MKTKISKSKVMERAWLIFRGNNPYSYSFSAALSRAWFVEKEMVAYAERKAVEASQTTTEATRSNPVSESFMAGCANYYKTTNRYYGD